MIEKEFRPLGFEGGKLIINRKGIGLYLGKNNSDDEYVPSLMLRLPAGTLALFSVERREIFLEVHFQPGRRHYRDKSFSGKKELLKFSFAEWSDFLEKWQKSTSLSEINEIRGQTDSHVASFAVDHLGFEFMYSLRPRPNHTNGIVWVMGKEIF